MCVDIKHLNINACEYGSMQSSKNISIGPWDYQSMCVWEHVSMGECDHHLKIDEGVATWLSVQEL